jgi:aldose 1-epimerase
MQDRVELNAPGVSVTIDLAAGGRAVSWTIDDVEVIGSRSSAPVEYGMYPMAPWAGRVRDNSLSFCGAEYPLAPSHGVWALHGTVLGSKSRLVDHASSNDRSVATIVTDLGPEWPWAGRLTSHWEVAADAVCTRLTLEAEEQSFPGVLGWHPWFNRRIGAGEPAIWSLTGPLLAERLEAFQLSGAFAPVDLGSRAFDDTFLVASRAASIEWPGQLRIDISSSHPWFVVFDELADYICIEPQSGPPNGINDSQVAPVTVVAPGEPLSLVNEWRITRGQPAG